MFEDLWNGILELTSRFVIPDWGSVIAMLPVLIFALAILVILVLFWKIWRAPKPRRGKVKVEPVPPPGVHMPGPSWAPPLGCWDADTRTWWGGWRRRPCGGSAGCCGR